LAPSLEKRRLQAYLLLLLLDGLVIAGSLASVSLVYLGQADEPQTIRLLYLSVPLYWGAALMTRTYSIETRRHRCDLASPARDPGDRHSFWR